MINFKKDEAILYTTETDNLIDHTEKVSNIYLRILISLFGVAGGDPPIKFNITLTNQKLYLEAIGISSWGRLPETRYVEEISFKDIKEISVSVNGQYEFINLYAKKNTKLRLRRNNENLDNIAQKISTELSNNINSLS